MGRVAINAGGNLAMFVFVAGNTLHLAMAALVLSKEIGYLGVTDGTKPSRD